jgi:hypothetical protein
MHKINVPGARAGPPKPRPTILLIRHNRRVTHNTVASRTLWLDMSMAGIAQVWILPEVLFRDLEFLALSEEEQRERLDHVKAALKAGDFEYLQGLPWVSLLNPNDSTEGGVH